MLHPHAGASELSSCSSTHEGIRGQGTRERERERERERREEKRRKIRESFDVI